MKNWQLGLIIAIIVEIISALTVYICNKFNDGLVCLAWGIPGFWPIGLVERLPLGSGLGESVLSISIITLLNTLLYTGIVWIFKFIKSKFST